MQNYNIIIILFSRLCHGYIICQPAALWLSKYLMWCIVLSHCDIHFGDIDGRGSLWD